jgi:hypothetical protein
MSDIADKGAATADFFLSVALRKQQQDASVAPPANGGECLYCGEPVPAPRRWCGPECRDEWETEQKRA